MRGGGKKWYNTRMMSPRKKTAKTAAAAAASAKKKAAAEERPFLRKRPARKRRWKWSDESRAKISASAKQTWQDPLVRKRRVEGIRKAMKTPEVRARIMERSEERRGRKHTAATIRKMRASALRHRGRKKTAAKKSRKKSAA